MDDLHQDEGLCGHELVNLSLSQRRLSCTGATTGTQVPGGLSAQL